MKIENVRQFDEALEEPYAWPGGYPRYFICRDGSALSYESARENAALIRESIRDRENNDWRVVAVDINWEDTDLHCDHTGEKIESAYGGDEGQQ